MSGRLCLEECHPNRRHGVDEQRAIDREVARIKRAYPAIVVGLQDCGVCCPSFYAPTTQMKLWTSIRSIGRVEQPVCSSAMFPPLARLYETQKHGEECEYPDEGKDDRHREERRLPSLGVAPAITAKVPLQR